ncbi:protein of unknown function [Pararobbsia alpina]
MRHTNAPTWCDIRIVLVCRAATSNSLYYHFGTSPHATAGPLPHAHAMCIRHTVRQ